MGELKTYIGNDDAIRALVTAYLGGAAHGYEPVGTHLLTGLNLRDCGGTATAASPLLQVGLKDLDLDVALRPKPLRFITSVTADITLLGTMMDRWPPRALESVLHLTLANPLPTDVFVNTVQLQAYFMNLAGDKIYDFSRVMEPRMRVAPAPALSTLDFELFPDEVSLPLGNWTEIKDLVREASKHNFTVGVKATLDLMVAPAWRQQALLERRYLGPCVLPLDAPGSAMWRAVSCSSSPNYRRHRIQCAAYIGTGTLLCRPP